MNSSKLYKSLKCLNDDELKAFQDFVRSPYFNKSQKLVMFLEHLSGPPKNANTLPKSLTGSRPQDLMHRLMNLLEEFLSLQKYRQNGFMQKIHLMQMAYENDITPITKTVERDIDTWHESSPLRDSNYFYESFMIHSERDQSFRLMGRISEDDSLQNKSNQLDLFYLSVKLKEGCELLNRSNIVSAQYDFKMLELMVDYLKTHPEAYQEHPAIKIYLTTFLMLKEPENEAYFHELVTLALECGPVFSREELRSIYTNAQNYCIRQINQGKTGFLRHLFGLNKHTLETGLVFGDNSNMQWDFKNYVSLGLRLKEYDWTLQVIDVFKEQLPETVRRNSYSYNLANYYYETGDYQKATKLLNGVEFTDIYYSLGAKAMLLKIYYRVEEEESFYSLVSSFGMYLKRNKLISKDNALIYENLIRYANRAFQLKTKLPYERKRAWQLQVATLRGKIIETQKIANIDWLLEEVNALRTNDGKVVEKKER